MFWESVIDGILLIARWEIWIGGILYLGGILGGYALLGVLMESDNPVSGVVGCIGSAIIAPFLHGIFLTLVVAWLMPIALGGPSATPVGFVLGHFGAVVIAAISAVLFALAASFLPIVGGLVANVPGVMTFLVGVVSFRVLAGSQLESIASEASISNSIYPGVWASIGFLAVTGILVSSQLVIANLPLRERHSPTESWDWFLSQLIGIVGGFLPVLMYISYVGNSLSAAASS